MKIMSMYLPQFHTIPENDKWWGEGFTEWTNVKKSEAVFEGHAQPREPLDYYNLADPKVMLNQMKLASEYKVDGFVFYHYWFKGKKLLEKPIENILNYDDIPIDFCLCWANGSWNRRWDSAEKEILIKQDYSDKKDWENHYQYFSKFFKKNNYLKKNNRPVLIIYDKKLIPNICEIYALWEKMALDEGYDGIHIIDVHRTLLTHEVPFYGNAVMRFEPFATLSELSENEINCISRFVEGIDKKHIYRIIDYSKFCEKMTSRYMFKKRNQYLGFFSGWDNSPRIGKRVSLIFDNNSPDIFEKYFEKQYKNSMLLENDYLFINAWNEWGEGAFLEPDKKNGYGYLKAIKKVREKYE